jgi:hypothetical protein
MIFFGHRINPLDVPALFNRCLISRFWESFFGGFLRTMKDLIFFAFSFWWLV